MGYVILGLEIESDAVIFQCVAYFIVDQNGIPVLYQIRFWYRNSNEESMSL